MVRTSVDRSTLCNRFIIRTAKRIKKLKEQKHEKVYVIKWSSRDNVERDRELIISMLLNVRL